MALWLFWEPHCIKHFPCFFFNLHRNTRILSPLSLCFDDEVTEAQRYEGAHLRSPSSSQQNGGSRGGAWKRGPISQSMTQGDRKQGGAMHWEFQEPPAPIKHPSGIQAPTLTSRQSSEMDGFWAILWLNFLHKQVRKRFVQGHIRTYD